MSLGGFMTDRPKFKYRAFLSYSQKDKTKAKRLHRALETYRAPKGIHSTLDYRRRIGRIFRDDMNWRELPHWGLHLRAHSRNPRTLSSYALPTRRAQNGLMPKSVPSAAIAILAESLP